MDERPETELISIPATPRVSTPEILTPSGQRSPRPATKPSSAAWTPTSFISPRFLSPIGTPMKRVLVNMKGYLEEMGHLTKLNPQDAWLPITESRNGNAHYAAFHNLNAGVGFQALVLPVAFAFLGWCVVPNSFFISNIFFLCFKISRCLCPISLSFRSTFSFFLKKKISSLEIINNNILLTNLLFEL